MSGARQAKAFAPGSVGNVAVGFDILGHAIAGLGDVVTARRIDEDVIRIAAINGMADLPLDPERNTAGRAVMAWRQAIGARFGVELTIDKGIPLGSGLGGSAASASAALVAANQLSEAPLPAEALYPFALAGEFAASGAMHGDNVAPQLLGGLVLATEKHLVRVPIPGGLTSVVAHPNQVLETRAAREVLKAPYPLSDFVQQSANLALVLMGCAKGDFDLIRAGLADVLVEPRRAALIPGFDAVKRAALDAGALGASISGAGPSVFAWCENTSVASAVGEAVKAAFVAATGAAPSVYISSLDAPGARVVSCDM